MRWQTEELIALVRKREPDWERFDSVLAWVHRPSPPATLPKDKTKLIALIEKTGRNTPLLWTGNRQHSDINIIYQAQFDTENFHALIIKDGDEVSLTGRFERYTAALATADLPSRWTFPTYFLALHEPNDAIFIKPRMMKWWLKFMGVADVWNDQPNGTTYGAILAEIDTLRAELAEFAPRDLWDVFSVIQGAYGVAKEVGGRLTSRAQVELDRPPTVYQPTRHAVALAEEAEEKYMPNPVVTLEAVAEICSIDVETLSQWKQAIERKGQAIFYGAPGTGKTFVAKQLARHLTGGGDGIMELVQFHPAYAYEDFMVGLRPKPAPNGLITYEEVPGRFVQFCERAERCEGVCVFIIDEINRADLARVFGELMYLLEYREESIPLAGGRRFTLPANVRIIGTMNTADRSIALIDHALRRRFAFIPLRPNYTILRKHHAESDYPVEPLITLLREVNGAIGDEDYHIGISFFLGEKDDLRAVWQTEIEPYLEEILFDRPDTLGRYRWNQITQTHQLGA